MNKSAYVAAKHGVVGFTKVCRSPSEYLPIQPHSTFTISFCFFQVVALENAKRNVTANCVCPGFVLTPLVSKQIEDRAKANNVSFETEKFNFLNEKQPSGEFVTPQELGELTAFLASDAAGQVRGAAWNMDGGWAAQ